jgi:hypothetical protein
MDWLKPLHSKISANYDPKSGRDYVTKPTELEMLDTINASCHRRNSWLTKWKDKGNTHAEKGLPSQPSLGTNKWQLVTNGEANGFSPRSWPKDFVSYTIIKKRGHFKKEALLRLRSQMSGMILFRAELTAEERSKIQQALELVKSVMDRESYNRNTQEIIHKVKNL